MAEWYYSQGDEQLGPVTPAQLKQLAGAGTLAATDLVWKDGMGDWVPASQVDGLFGSAATPPARGAAPATSRTAATANETPSRPPPTGQTAPAAPSVASSAAAGRAGKSALPLLEFLRYGRYIAHPLILLGLFLAVT